MLLKKIKIERLSTKIKDWAIKSFMMDIIDPNVLLPQNVDIYQEFLM